MNEANYQDNFRIIKKKSGVDFEVQVEEGASWPPQGRKNKYSSSNVGYDAE